MIFLTATSIGLLAGMTRSFVSVTIAAFLVLAVFIVAALSGSASFTGLFLAILGYNFGLINLVAITALVQSVRHA